MSHVEHPVLAHLPALTERQQALVNQPPDQGMPQQQQQGQAN